MFNKSWLSIFVFSALLVVLSGCASNDVKQDEEGFARTMERAEASVESRLQTGERDEAVRILHDVAILNPARKEPWSRLARLHFDAEDYAQAIVAAEEVLQRDTSDREAKSIRVVAGLRIAAQSLRDLKDDIQLQGDARSDALGLAKVMRETLGEDVLVPPAVTNRRRAAPAQQAPAQRAPAPQRPAETRGQARPANPFGALR